MKRLGIILVSILFLVSCSSSSSTLPDLSDMGKAVVISREEGSGTRDEFESLINTTESNTTVMESTQEVIDAVKEDKNAIGYVAYSAVKDDEDVKILSVDNKEVSLKNIKKKKYGLTRNYYIVYKGQQTELESDFESYIKTAGQKAVQENAIEIKEPDTFLSSKPSGNLVVHGSTSMQTIMDAWIEDYASYNPNATIEVEYSDSSTGILDVLNETCDIALSSRELKDYEKELLETETVALDAIVMIVNPDNPLTNLSKKQIQTLYQGDISKWSELE